MEINTLLNNLRSEKKQKRWINIMRQKNQKQQQNSVSRKVYSDKIPAHTHTKRKLLNGEYLVPC